MLIKSGLVDFNAGQACHFSWLCERTHVTRAGLLLTCYAAWIICSSLAWSGVPAPVMLVLCWRQSPVTSHGCKPSTTTTSLTPLPLLPCGGGAISASATILRGEIVWIIVEIVWTIETGKYLGLDFNLQFIESRIYLLLYLCVSSVIDDVVNKYHTCFFIFVYHQ